MLTAVATSRGNVVEIQFLEEQLEAESTVPPKDGPSPIAPELKELAWSASAFVVFALLMRLVLYPRLKKGMDSRYESIRSGHEGADTARASARAEVAEYQSQLASVKASANERTESARHTLETERNERLAQVNEGIKARRLVAQAEVDAAREAVRGDLESAVGDVVSRTVELAIGKVPDAAVVAQAVESTMLEGATR